MAGRLPLLAKLLHSTLARRLVLSLTVILTLGAAWLFMPPAEYLPEGEEPKAFSSMIAPPGYNLSEMAQIAEELKAILTAQVNADPAAFDRGDTAMPPLKSPQKKVPPVEVAEYEIHVR